MPLSEGIHRALDASVYHRRELGVVSKSALDVLHRSPAHYKAWVDGELSEEDTPALRFGSAFHCAILEPERFVRTYIEEPDFGDCRIKANRETRDAWREANAGRISLTEEDVTRIGAMNASLLAHPLAGKMLRDGEPELTVSWRDQITGLHCKVRADYYVEKLGMIADVKTTMDASPDAFRRDVVKHRYFVQDALYRAGFAAVGAKAEHFVFIAVEKEPPHAVAVYALDAEAVEKGHEAAWRDMHVMAECMRTGRWPGYDAGISPLSLPPWAA